MFLYLQKQFDLWGICRYKNIVEIEFDSAKNAANMKQGMPLSRAADLEQAVVVEDVGSPSVDFALMA